MDMRDVFDSVMCEPKLYALLCGDASKKMYESEKMCLAEQMERPMKERLADLYYREMLDRISKRSRVRKEIMDAMTIMPHTMRVEVIKDRNNVIGKNDIELVNFNDKKGTTVIKWKDGTISKVKVQLDKGDTYNPELGMAMCIAKKALGNKGNFNEVFKKWLPEGEE